MLSARAVQQRRFEVRLGKLAYRGKDHEGNPIFQQKKVDCMVGVDMALLAGKGRITSCCSYGLPVGSRFVGTPTVSVGTSDMGRDYRLGYRLGALGGAGTTVELGVDAQRRERPLQGGTDHGARSRGPRWAGSGGAIARPRAPSTVRAPDVRPQGSARPITASCGACRCAGRPG